MTKEELQKIKDATTKLTKWDSSGKAFGHLTVIENSPSTKKADRLYEFWCLMKLLDDLKTNYEIELISEKRKDTKIFPQSPAPKKGWAYFVLKHKKNIANTFQICYGTKIKLSNAEGTTIAPDISFQKIYSTDDPDESMVELIMDPKYKYNKTKSLPIDTLHAFIQRVNALKVTDASDKEILFSSFIDIKANCLLTNGRALQDQQMYCHNFFIKQVEHFDIDTNYNVVG